MNYTHILQDKHFLQTVLPFTSSSVVGEEGCYGIRNTFWFFCMEYYVSEKEPVVEQYKGIRLIFWTPFSVLNNTIPTSKNRYISVLGSRERVYTFLDIRDEENLLMSLSKRSREYIVSLNKQKRYCIVSVTYEVFKESYQTIFCHKSMILSCLKRIERTISFGKDNTHFYVIVDRDNNRTVAGICVVDFMETQQSYYIAAFTDNKNSPSGAHMWLLVYWMRESRKKGISFVNLGVIWTEGQDTSWKGFSDFKMKFRPQMIVPEKQRVRITFS